MSHSEQQHLLLMPTRRDEQTKTFQITKLEWQAVLKLCRRHGYYPPDGFGLDRNAVKWFVRALQQGLATEELPEAERASVERLLEYCESDARLGFVLELRWNRATM